MPAATIVIRAKNEEFWIGKTLASVRKQSFKDFEVVLVDNKSSDNTRRIFESEFPEGKVVELESYTPGKGLNVGIAAGSAPFAVILSAHCVPVDDGWLESFMELMEDGQVGAAYGRQLPLPSSHPLDKRDLLNTFGVERRIQKADTFFHNANSVIRRDLWERFPFDEDTPHIEDRLWAEHIIEAGKWIAYEPKAAVYHHHGIYHHSDISRAQAISEILTNKTMKENHTPPDMFTNGEAKILYCLLGHSEKTDERLKEFLKARKGARTTEKILVHTSAPGLIDKALAAPVPRRAGDDEKTFVKILGEMLGASAEQSFFPDSLVYVNLKLDGAEPGRVSRAVKAFYDGLYDSVFFAEREYSNVWAHVDDGSYKQVVADYSPRSKKDPVYIARYGMGMVTRPSFIRSGELVGTNVAIITL